MNKPTQVDKETIEKNNAFLEDLDLEGDPILDQIKVKGKKDHPYKRKGLREGKR